MKTLAFLMFLACLALSAMNLHADVSATAAVLDDPTATLAALMPALNTLLANPIHVLLAVLLGAMLSSWGHQIMDGIIDESTNPIVHLFGHALLGMVLAALTVYAGKNYGITTQEASAAFLGFVGLVPTLKKLGLMPVVPGSAVASPTTAASAAASAAADASAAPKP